jgi:hypothetical protein
VTDITAQSAQNAKIRYVKQGEGTARRDIHGHVLFMYKNRQERLRTLAGYFGDGLAEGELCIFVTPDPPEKVIKDFLSVEFDASEAVENGSLRIFEMAETYLPHGKFVADYMLLNVANFITEARTKGYTGIRTAGEMAWLYEHPEFLSGATEYEQRVNGLNASNPEFTGLCLYPVRKDSKPILDSAIRTHPSFIYSGAAQIP